MPALTQRQRPSSLFWMILLAATALRVGYLLTYAGMPDWAMLTVDNHYHHNWALDIVNGDIFGDTTYFRAPLYVFALAAGYALFGVSLWTARIFGLVIGLASVTVTYALGKRAFSERVGLLAAALQAVWPTVLYFEFELLLDPLFTLLFEVALWRLLVWFETDNWREAIFAGLMLGLAAITRPTALVLLAVVGLALLMKRPLKRQAGANLAMIAIGLAAVIGPIFIRNLIVARDPVMIASQGGINLYIGNNESADGVSAVLPEPLGFNWQIRDITWIAERESGGTLTAGEVSSYWSDRAVAWITDNPGAFAQLYLEKLYRHISNIEISNNRALGPFFERMPWLAFNPLQFYVLFAFALAGVTAISRNRAALLIVAALSLIMLASALFFFNSRFRLPMMPLYSVLAAAGVFALFGRLRKRSGSLLIPVVALLGGGVLSYVNFVPLPAGASPQAIMVAANSAYAQGDYRQALNFALEAARVAPDFPEVNLNIANAYVRLGQTETARRYYEREYALHPRRPKALVNLASLALVEGDLTTAVAHARRAIALRPYDFDANIVLIRALGADTTVPPDTLIGEIRAAAARTDDDIYLCNDAGTILTNRGRLSEARELLHRAAQASPPAIETDDAAFLPNFRHSPANMRSQRARAEYQIGFLAGLEGRYTEAIERSREAIALDSSLADAWVNLISGYLADGRLTEAEATLAASLVRFPDHPALREIRRRLRAVGKKEGPELPLRSPIGRTVIHATWCDAGSPSPRG